MIDKKLTNQEIVAREWEKFQFENSAYSELKKWCEKHLKFSEWSDVTTYETEEKDYKNTIEIEGILLIFNDDGTFYTADMA